MVFAMMILSCQTLWGRAGQHRTCPARAPPPLLAQQTHSLKDGYDDLHDDDEDHDDEDDDIDEDEDVLNQMKNLPTIPPLT